MEVVEALVRLARAVKNQPVQKDQVEQLQKSVSEKLVGANARNILAVCDQIVVAGFSSTSDSIEPDGKGGIVWAPERSQIFCDCLFRLVEVLEKNTSPEAKDTCRKIIGRAMNLATLVSFCRQFKVVQPLPNLLSFEGRNETAHVLEPKMPELTKSILALLNQAKELEKQGRYNEVEATRKIADRLNKLYSKMEKNVLPWLERKEPSTITLGMAMSSEEEGGLVIEVVKEVLRKTSRKK